MALFFAVTHENCRWFYPTFSSLLSDNGYNRFQLRRNQSQNQLQNKKEKQIHLLPVRKSELILKTTKRALSLFTFKKIRIFFKINEPLFICFCQSNSLKKDKSFQVREIICDSVHICIHSLL